MLLTVQPLDCRVALEINPADDGVEFVPPERSTEPPVYPAVTRWAKIASTTDCVRALPVKLSDVLFSELDIVRLVSKELL